MWPSSTQNVASVTVELNFQFYFILINFNFNSHRWLLFTVLDSTALQAEATGSLDLTRYIINLGLPWLKPIQSGQSQNAEGFLKVRSISFTIKHYLYWYHLQEKPSFWASWGHQFLKNHRVGTVSRLLVDICDNKLTSLPLPLPNPLPTLTTLVSILPLHKTHFPFFPAT